MSVWTMEVPWTGEGYVAIEGGQLHYRECGQGQPFVVLPKLGGWAADWRHIAPLLANGHRVIAVDPPGHGGAAMLGAPPWAIPLEDSARALLALFDALDLNDVNTGGNSLGGCIALVAAALAPERIRRLVLVSCATTEAVSREELERKEREQPSPDFDSQGYPLPRDHDEMARRNGNLDRQVSDEMNLSRARAGQWIQPSERGVGLADFPAIMATVACPTLLLYGERDPLTALEADGLGALRNGRAARVPEAGRFPHQERPEATAAVLRDFLA